MDIVEIWLKLNPSVHKNVEQNSHSSRLDSGFLKSGPKIKERIEKHAFPSVDCQFFAKCAAIYGGGQSANGLRVPLNDILNLFNSFMMNEVTIAE